MVKSLTYEAKKKLADLSTFGIGGEAFSYCEVHSVKEMQLALKEAQKQQIPWIVIGKGSNCLFDDRGFSGLVIHNKIDFLEHQGSSFRVGAGYSFALLGTRTAKMGWEGLEFACGIPGSVGGAVYMNAGVGTAEVKDVLTTVDFVDAEGTLLSFSREDLEFGYRSSPFQSMAGAIVSASFQLEPCAEAKKKQREMLSKRITTQPYDAKSVGCIFRNPSKEKPAGQLIDQCGLKGKKIGGAMVSPKHANFIVNTGDAKADDVRQLMQLIKEEILHRFGVTLETEVRFIPYQ